MREGADSAQPDVSPEPPTPPHPLTPLEPGMLLLDPDYMGRPQLWTVKTAGKKSASVIAAISCGSMTARLTVGHVPNGWIVVDTDTLARKLAEERTGTTAADYGLDVDWTKSEPRS